MTWEEIIAALEAILAGTYSTPDEMAAELATIVEAMKALIEQASTSEATAEEENALADNAERANTIIGKIVARIEKKRKVRVADIPAVPRTTTPSAPSQRVQTTPVVRSGRPFRGKAFRSLFGEKAEQMAYAAGRQIAAALRNDTSSVEWCRANGVPLEVRGQTEGNDALGGLLVTDQLEQAILFYREERGVARRIMEVVPMTAETRRVNRNLGGTNVVPLGEGQAYTISDVVFSGLSLVAKKFGALSKASYELGEDTYANLAEELAKDHGFAHAVKEDQCAFTGTGALATNGIVGVAQAFQTLVENAGGTWTNDAHKAYASSIRVAASAALSGVTLANFYSLGGAVATFSGMNNRFYMPSQIWFDVVVPLLQAAQGNTSTIIQDGVTIPQLNGYPVEFIDELYTPILASANNRVICLFGDASQAGMFGDRLGLSITSDGSVGFLNDETYWKSTARYGVNWWNLGNASATASLRTQRGAIAALVTRNS